MKLLLILVACLAGSAHAATHYIRDGGTASSAGTGSCTGWAAANACDQLPTTLVRGDTYCIASGSYSARELTTPDSGTATITIKKAVQGDGTCDQGPNWLSSYGDGQATFSGGWNIKTRYWVIDGAKRNEANWGDATSYGFRMLGGMRAAPGDGGHPGPGCSADNVTVRYSAMGSANSGESNADVNGGFYLASFSGPGASSCENWVIDKNYIFNVVIPVMCAGCNGFVIQYNRIGESWGKEAIRGQHSFSGHIIRYNEFVDSCQGKDTCTGEIAAWGFTGTGLYDGNQIYGNVFYKTGSKQQINTGGAIIIGGNGSSWLGSGANNNQIFNNTIVGLGDFGGGWYSQIIVNGGSGNVCRNNLWYAVADAGGASCNVASNNVKASANPFVSYDRTNWAGTNLRLSGATAAGMALGNEYMLDLQGATRGADGIWDLGAYEFRAGSASALAPPAYLTVR